jgi:cell division septation protein DedD
MLRTGERETEILLGNKQLLGIFFVVAILLGMAFTGGYMVGRSSVDKKGSADSSTATAQGNSAAETHAVMPDPPTSDGSNTPTTAGAPQKPTSGGARPSSEDGPPLGSPRTPKPAQVAGQASVDGFQPESGQLFLQVAAVSHDEALAVADVLHKKGFRAHAVPKPGSTKLYRVLIGPIRDTADLASTRDSLRKTGFREVITQRYQ